MTASTATRTAPEVRFSFPKGTDNGLWSALASQVNGSAAGSRLAGSPRPGQPISAAAMFGYDAGTAVPVVTGDLPAGLLAA